jgi:hypothetical protein
MRTPPPLFEDVRFEREGWKVLLKLSSLVEMFESFNQVSVIVTIFRLFCVILKNRSNSLFLIDRELKVGLPPVPADADYPRTGSAFLGQNPYPYPHNRNPRNPYPHNSTRGPAGNLSTPKNCKFGRILGKFLSNYQLFGKFYKILCKQFMFSVFKVFDD